MVGSPVARPPLGQHKQKLSPQPPDAESMRPAGRCGMASSRLTLQLPFHGVHRRHLLPQVGLRQQPAQVVVGRQHSSSTQLST